MRYSAWFPIVLLAALAGMTLWLSQQFEVNEERQKIKLRHAPDYIVLNFSATQMGPDGTPRYMLNARRMVHFPDDDTTHLEAPHLTRIDNKGITITATARKALLTSNGDEAQLIDDVRLVRAPYADKSELTVETTFLRVLPDIGIAQTDQPVRISDARSLTTSVGLEFNNETQVLKLLSNVRIRYQSQSPPL